ncbi:hypothetical protein [Streptomyces sp. NPDC089799]|uniref:hypothetical protein n=1 Tax=Streptomyces sp. NPDC089799 TaxID=3155066 RepID=UPI00344799AE
MTEPPRSESDRQEPSDGLRELREQLERRGTELRELRGQFGALSGDLGDLRGKSDELTAKVRRIGTATEQLQTGLTAAQTEIGRVQDDFKEFRAQYERDQAALAAHFELDRLTGQWQARFGNRDRVRSLAHGLVRKLTPKLVARGVLGTGTVRTALEEHLAHDPDFWLVHAALAVVARLDGDDLLFDHEAQAKLLDLGKAHLFFSLAAARTGDHERAGTSMDGYLQSAVDPGRLGRDFLVVLDAVASRELGDQALGYARQVMVHWAAEARIGGTVSRASTRRWGAQLHTLLFPPDDRFAALGAAYDGDWGELREGLRLATVTTATLDHLGREFPPAGPAAPARYAEAAIDRLIRHMEPDEAVLHTRMEGLRRLIEHRGDERAAQRDHALRQEVDAEVTDFATLLDNAVFKPSQIALGDDARRFALLQVLPNLGAAAEEIVTDSLRRRPREFPVVIEGWRTVLPVDPLAAVDGTALSAALDADLAARTEVEAGAVDRNLPRRVGGTAGGLAAAALAPVLVDGPFVWLLVVLGVVAGAWGLLDVIRVPAERTRIRTAGEARREHARRRLDDVLVRRVLFFEEWKSHADRLAALRTWKPVGR